MTKAQEPELRLVRSHEACEREVRLNKAGIPVTCGRPGYVKFKGKDGKTPTLCRKHFNEAMTILQRTESDETV